MLRPSLFAPLAALALAFAVGPLAACSDDHDHAEGGHGDGGHTSDYPACQAIIDACHPKDDGTNLDVNGCHETAHDATSNAPCEAEQARCVALCEAAAVPGSDAGTDGAASPADATADQ